MRLMIKLLSLCFVALLFVIGSFDANAIRNPDELPHLKPSKNALAETGIDKEQPYLSQASAISGEPASQRLSEPQKRSQQLSGDEAQQIRVSSPQGHQADNQSIASQSNQVKSGKTAIKALTSKSGEKNSAARVDNPAHSLANSAGVGHTKPRNKVGGEEQLDTPETVMTPMVVTEDHSVSQSSLDQGLIEAQIDDVLSSAEFLALEASEEFSTAQDKNKDDDLDSDPEQLLNQLDASDLMDYVADDDLWKEQLTLEDEPF